MAPGGLFFQTHHLVTRTIGLTNAKLI